MPSRLKLNPHAKGLFLKFGFDSILQPFGNYERQKPSSAFRLMLISKTFLNSTILQRSKPDYRLILTYHEEDMQIIKLNFAPDNYIFSTNRLQPSLSFEMHFRDAFGLVRFLQPPFIGIRVTRKMFNEEFFVIQHFLEITNGKIGLYLNQKDGQEKPTTEYCYYKLIRKFASRICELDCQMDFLDNDNSSFPRLKLDHFEANHIHDQSQIHRVLHYHNIKSLDLYLQPDYFDVKRLLGLQSEAEESTEELLDYTNKYVENVEIRGFRIDHVTLDELVRSLIKCCPNIKAFDLRTSFHFHFDEVPVANIFETVLHFYSLMEPLRSEMNGINESVKFFFDFSLCFMYRHDDQQYNHHWMRTLFERNEFKDWLQWSSYCYNPFQKTNIYTYEMGTRTDEENRYKISASACCFGPRVPPSHYEGSDFLLSLRRDDESDEEDDTNQDEEVNAIGQQINEM